MELALKPKQIVDLKKIFTRSSGLKIFDSAKLEKIAKGMVEVERATQTAGRQNTQFTSKNMTLFLTGRTPYSMLRQCLAQIERKREALQETIFKMKFRELKVKGLMVTLENTSDVLARERIELSIQKIQFQVNSSILYIEGALKEIAQFQEIYEQIKKHNNIGEWDEVDYEKAESEHHIKQVFIQSLRDIVSAGRVNVGNLEYFENCGIDPLAGVMEVSAFIALQKKGITATNNLPSLETTEHWLDAMVEKYKYMAKEKLNRIGINSIDDWYVYKEEKHGERI